jgi:hypothetical protein
MKLTTEQIEYVENYIISKDIKWYELQVELTDHMVTSMEVLGKKIDWLFIRSNNMLRINLGVMVLKLLKRSELKY